MEFKTELYGKNISVTGATGLIGQNIVKTLLCLDANVIAVVRNKEKAQKIFIDNNGIKYIVCDIVNLPIRKMDIDFIIHAAANTSSKEFIENPVGISFIALEGTRRVLELAKLNHVKSLVYLSSMEVYGAPKTDEKIDELYSTNIDTMSTRSAYPESKRMCENLCASYAAQYGVPTKVVRLTQTFGPGVEYHDGRVFAEFARCAIEGKNIVLRTKGETKRAYLFIDDAVSAILTVLIKGKIGEAYNAANEDTYCSIYEMAELVANKCCNQTIGIVIAENDVSNYGYAPTLKMNLSTKKIQEIGWKATTNLQEMFQKSINYMMSIR